MTHLLLWTCLAMQAAQPQISNLMQAQEHLKLAIASREHGDPDSAVAELRRALELNPNLLEADRLMGLVLLSQGYSEDAIPYLRKAQAYDLLGRALLEEHQTTEAVQALLEAVRKQPDDSELLFYLGKAASLLTNKAFSGLMSLDPESPWAHQLKAESNVALGQKEAAEHEYRTALKMNAALRGVHLAIGMLKMDAGDLSSAETEFRAETQLRPGDAEAAWRLGSVLLQKGNTRLALAELKRSNSLRPHMIETLFDLGKASGLENETAEAEKAWLEVIALGDTGEMAASSHFQLSQLYRRQNKTAEANRQHKRFLELQPKRPERK
jgi:tetratricopeptide (TPR) repeat protein